MDATDAVSRKSIRAHLTSLSCQVHIEGNGPDIVWVAGGGGRATDWHENYTSAFADSYRSISFDNRGTSGTGCSMPEPWSIGDMAKDTAEIIERFCGSQAVVVGHSMGAQVTLQLALDRPDLVAMGVVLAGSARGHDGWLGDYMRAEIEMRRRGVHLEPEFAAVHYAALMYPASALGDRELWSKVRDALSSPDVHQNTEDTLISQWQPCLDFDVLDLMGGLTVPLEVFQFAEDVCSPPSYGRELAEVAPRARYHEVSGLGHASLFGHRPEEVATLLRACIDEYFGR